MTAATKEQIQQAALNALSQYPTVAQFVQAGDPRVLAQIGAQAAMLAMLAEQVDMAQFEPFLKARDGTVLADATLRGVLPLARACRVEVTLTNTDTADFFVDAGRRFIDPRGRIFEADSWVVVPAAGSATLVLSQRARRVVTHKVGASASFYRIEVEQTDEDIYLNTLEVFRDGQQLAYSPDWCNVGPGDLAYQVETDERRKLWVCLGMDGVVGYGAKAGDQFELRIAECDGRITDLAVGDAFNFEYIYTQAEGRVKVAMAAMVEEGASPLTMPELRVIARYPSIYDHNAVYLGEFDFLLRRYLSNIRFLCVWNEQIEETVRAPSVNNINRLFVSGLVEGMTNAAFEERVTELIGRADDSYKVQFVATVPTPVTVVVNAKVSVVHDPATVEAQIRAAILGKYGDGQPDVSKGLASPIRHQAVFRLLRDSVPALQDELSDFDLSVTLPGTVLPEHFLHITQASLTVNVTLATFNSGTWNY